MSFPSPSTPQLAVLYEHPQWFQPLFAALERRGLPFVTIELANRHLLLQMSPQAEEMDRFAVQVIEPMRAKTPELA